LVGQEGSPPVALQPLRPLYCNLCVCSPLSSQLALRARWHERPLLTKEGLTGEKWLVKFSQIIRLQRNCWVL
jgi:hypothetical protein